MIVNKKNKQGSRVQNSTRKYTKREEKVKLNKEAHQDARQIETELLVETKHMATSFRRQRRESLRTRLSTWPMKITSFSLNNFAPEEFFGGAKSVSMNGPKFSKSDRTMKAFSFVERNKSSTIDEKARLPIQAWFLSSPRK